MTVDVQQIRDKVASQSETIHRIRTEVGKVLVGQEQMVSRLMVALLTGGHVLLEGVPVPTGARRAGVIPRSDARECLVTFPAMTLGGLDRGIEVAVTDARAALVLPRRWSALVRRRGGSPDDAERLGQGLGERMLEAAA